MRCLLPIRHAGLARNGVGRIGASARHQRGFSLIEAMVAVIIMSTSLLSLALLQVLSVRASSGAYLRAQAVVLANDMAERMRANPLAALRGAYDLLEMPATGSDGRVSGDDLAEWTATVSSNLPAGHGSVRVEAGLATIRLEWMDRSKPLADDQTAAADTNSELTLRSSL